MQREFPRDKYIDPMRRCQFINPTTADGCESPPQKGKSFCFVHDPEQAGKRLEAQRAGGLNRRQPEPPPRIPPNLPLVKLESRGHVLVVQEALINFVLQGQMDIRVANNIGYLCMGALMTIDSTERAERQARLDAERAANRAEDKAERKAAREAKQAAPKAAEEAAQKDKPQGWFFRAKYGEKRHITEVTTTLTTCGPDARTETYRACATGVEFVSSTRPDLLPLYPDDVNPEKTPEMWALCQKAKQAKAETEAQADAQAAQQAKPEGRATQPGPQNLAAHKFERPAPPESGEKKPKRDRYTPTETGPPEVCTY
jgi:hypothetical protein